QDRPVLAPELVLRRVGVVDIVRRIAKRHVGQLSAQHALDVGQNRGVAAQQAMVAQDPEVARLADRLLRRLRNLVLGLIARRLAPAPPPAPARARRPRPPRPRRPRARPPAPPARRNPRAGRRRRPPPAAAPPPGRRPRRPGRPAAALGGPAGGAPGPARGGGV